jgi:hypothetical protein
MQFSRMLGKFLLGAAIAAAPCSVGLPAAATPAGKPAKAVAAGTWGGDHVIVEVSEKGVQLEFDCAHGQISQPIALNERGDFDVPGTFSPEHGGPVRSDEAESSNPARYSGHVTGDTMTLTVAQGKEKLGTFTLTRGARPVLRKCR